METSTVKKPNNIRWFALIIACIVNLCVGSIYSWSVFANPLCAYLSTFSANEITSLSVVFTIANAVGPITMICGGFINDKLGPKIVILTGGIMYGVGMILSGLVKSAGALICTYGLLVGLGLGMVSGCVVATSVKLFPDKRGLAGGLCTGFFGSSSVLIPPIANALIVRFGVNKTLFIIGICMMLIICPLAFVLSACMKKADIPQHVSANGATVNMNWKQMLGTPYFYIMIIMIFCGAISGLMIISQASPMSQNLFGITPADAAAIVSMLALFNTGGRLICGPVSDKLGINLTLRISFGLLAAGQALLFISTFGIKTLFVIGVCLIGISFGSTMGIYPGFTALQFGSKNNSVNYGIMFSGFAIAGFVGPVILNSVYNGFGTYNMAFIIAIICALCGIILSFKKSKKEA